eukprot:2021529-Alexandrium_andersonii.AAC.1
MQDSDTRLGMWPQRRPEHAPGSHPVNRAQICACTHEHAFMGVPLKTARLSIAIHVRLVPLKAHT